MVDRSDMRVEGAPVGGFGGRVLLLPVAAPWTSMREALDEFEPGFVLQREQPAAQERGDLAAAP